MLANRYQHHAKNKPSSCIIPGMAVQLTKLTVFALRHRFWKHKIHENCVKPSHLIGTLEILLPYPILNPFSKISSSNKPATPYQSACSWDFILPPPTRKSNQPWQGRGELEALTAVEKVAMEVSLVAVFWFLWGVCCGSVLCRSIQMVT